MTELVGNTPTGEDGRAPGTVVFLHAHPDDESIFTGGTIALLADAGHRVVVVFATSGELGGAGPGVGALRRAEAERACARLGVQRVVHLDHHDSGLDEDPVDQPLGSFASVRTSLVAEHLADIVIGERAQALVTYDAGGIYGHPDHVQAHRVGASAAESAGLATWYEVTVDREYLHFVDTHVAAAASRSLPSPTVVGSVSAEIDLMVDVRPALATKLAAIDAHRSQVDDATFGTASGFPEVYGFEWYVRHGLPGPIDSIVVARSTPRAAGALP